ncbi:MAG: PAS domain S-box protein [Phaeodactylibacter sp.]|uniref:ATP-binding protein n=1 Tax=Phaeodactylibacter sp. TaxID=1940289 RepID=UPI0032F04737
MRIRLIICFICCLSFWGSPLTAQQYKLFNYNELDGLQNTLVKAAVSDSFGLIWLATDGGLIRYDGHQFHSYRDKIPTPFIKDIIQVGQKLLASSDEGLYWIEPSLQSAVIRKAFPNQSIRLTKKLFQDEEGRIWGSNNDNVFRANGKDLKIYPFSPEYHSEDFTLSYSFVEDGWGNVYTISKNGVLFKYEEAEDRFSKPLYQLPTKVNAALQMSKGEIWVGTYGGIFQLMLNENGTLQSAQKINALNPIAMLRLKNGSIAAAVRNSGVFQIDGKGQATALQQEEWPVTAFSSLNEGRNGDLWLSTDNGLLLLKPKFFESVFADQLDGHYIQSIAHYQGQTYLSDGGQIFVTGTGTEDDKLQSFFEPPFEAYSIKATPTGLWIGGAGGQLMKLGWDKKVLRRHDLSAYGDAVFNLAVDQNGWVWICQSQSESLLCLKENGRIKQYKQQGEAWPENPEAVFFNPNSEELLVGGVQADKPLFKYDVLRDSFLAVEGQLQVDKDQDFRVIDIAHSPGWGVVVGASLGLFQYHKKAFNAIRPEKTNGVSVLAIAIGAGDEVWFATANGLNRLEDSTILTYTTMHGLPSKAINWRNLKADALGRIWAGTPDGLAVNTFPMPGNQTDRPLLLQVESSKGVVYEKVSHSFEADMDDYLSVRYLSVGFPSSLTEYRIEISDDNSPAQVIYTRDNQLSFSDLNKGVSEVSIQGRQSSAHHWSEPLKFHLQISTVWYKSRNGILGIILALGVVVFVVNLLRQTHYQRQSKRLSAYNQELEEKVQAGIQDYQMLVNYIGDSVLKVNSEGEVLYTSPSWLNNYGYSSEETDGQRLSLFVHPEDIEKTILALEALKGEGAESSFEMEHRLKHRNGEWLWVETKGELEPRSGEIVLIIRDITERKNSEQRLQSFADMQKILMDISSKYINLPLGEEESAINVSLQQMGRFVDADRVYIFDYHFEEEICTNTYEWCREGIDPEIDNLQTVPLEMLPDWVDAHTKGLPMYIPDVFDLPVHSGIRQVLDPQGIKSLLAVPLMNGSHCIGFVGFDSVRHWHQYTQREITLLKLFGQMLVNIQMRTQKQRDLEQLLEKTTDQNERLREFSFMTSHNIRASVANLLALNEMIKAEPDNPDYLEMLEVTTKKLDTTISNINHLLNFEKEINQKDKEDCNLAETINRVVDLNNQIIKKHGVRVRVNVPPYIQVKAIPAHLDSIFHNLLTNAIKYGATETSKDILIDAHAGKVNTVVSIQDFGLGIDLERFRDKLFKLGSRLHVASADGQGLGLYMTKNQIEGLGGQIEVDSEVDKGTTFKVTLPMSFADLANPDLTVAS